MVKKDLFTATALGIKSIEPFSRNRISWALAQNFLRLDGSEIFKSISDTLDTRSGPEMAIWIWWFYLLLVDYLRVLIKIPRWSEKEFLIWWLCFSLSFLGNLRVLRLWNFTFGQTCTGSPIASQMPERKPQRIQHAGGHSILYRDFDEMAWVIWS